MGFETAIPASERPQTHPLGGTAYGIDSHLGVIYSYIYAYILLQIISVSYKLSVPIGTISCYRLEMNIGPLFCYKISFILKQ